MHYEDGVRRCKCCESKLEENEQTYCKYCAPTSNAQIKTVKKPKPTVEDNRMFVEITCTECGTKCKVRTSSPEIYTEEVRKTWRCMRCKYCKLDKKRSKWQI